MNRIKKPIKIFTCIFAFLMFSKLAFAQVSVEQQNAKNLGIILYNQHKTSSATVFLTIAAEAGDHEAQYYLGESLRRKNHYMSPEARTWYETSAAQGDLYAMIQLGRNDKDICTLSNVCPPHQKNPIEWLNQAKDLALPKANDGDGEAMYIMYEITLDDAWLEKAALAGNTLAQYWMGVRYQQGEGFFLPWNREQTVAKWFKSSAEGGHPKSKMEYAAILFESGDIEGFRHWNQRAASTGYAETVYGYGSDLAHEPDTYGFPLDLIKGYALIYLLSELDGGGGMQANVEYKLPLIAAKMTLEQISEAKEFAKIWKSGHPPLSFFPDKLSR